MTGINKKITRNNGAFEKFGWISGKNQVEIIV